MKRLLLVSMFAFSLIGCASQQPPSPTQIASADYGSLPVNYQEQIKNHFGSTLKDPYTAQYTFLPTFKGYSQDGPWAPSGGKVFFGWVAPILVNAKNSYGGYTGNKKYTIMFSGGVMYDVTINDMYDRVKPVN